MASSETDESEKQKSVLNLVTLFERDATENTKSKPNPEANDHPGSTVESTEEVVLATFEKKVGDTVDFKFYFGRNSRGTTGLFIRSVRSQSSIEGLLKPDDQLVKINDQDIRNSESDVVSSVLENLSGTVKVEVIRIKKLQRRNSTKTKPSVPKPRITLPILRTSNDNRQSPEKNKSDDQNLKIQLRKKNANPDHDTQRRIVQTPEKKADNTKSDIKQLQEHSAGLKPETRQSLNNYITPHTHHSQEKSSEIPPTQQEYITDKKQEMHQTQSDTNINIEQKVNTQKVLGEDADINQLQEDNNDPHTSQNFENDTKIQQLEEQISQKNAEKDDIELIQRRLENKCNSLETIIELIRKENGIQVRDLEIQNTFVNMQKQRLEYEMLRLRQQNSIMVNKNETLQKENIDKDDQIENRRQEIEKQNKEIQQLQQKNSRIEQENENKDNEIQQLRQENSEMKNTIEHFQTKDNEIQQLRQENSEKNNRIGRLQKENEIKDTKIKQLRQQNSRVEQEKNNKDNEIRNLQQENNKKNNEIQQLRRENSEKNNTIEHLQRENEIKNNEILLIRIENQRHEQEVESKKNEILNLQQEIENNTGFAETGSVVVSDEELGRGGYGTVYKGEFYGTKVAVKEYYHIILSNYYKKVLRREINMASQCRHPNLLQFICASENDEHHLLIVTELLDMALRELIEQHAEAQSLLSSQDVQSISLDVARGLNYLHSKKPDPIIHRDISSANVLLSIVNGVVVRAKISDYGSANFMERCNTKNPGAAIYAAPEAGSSRQDPKYDVFSYGILVCEMAICDMPDPKNRRDQINQISHIGIKELVNNCTRDESKERPNMHNVITTWENMKME